MAAQTAPPLRPHRTTCSAPLACSTTTETSKRFVEFAVCSYVSVFACRFVCFVRWTTGWQSPWHANWAGGIRRRSSPHVLSSTTRDVFFSRRLLPHAYPSSPWIPARCFVLWFHTENPHVPRSGHRVSSHADPPRLPRHARLSFPSRRVPRHRSSGRPRCPRLLGAGEVRPQSVLGKHCVQPRDVLHFFFACFLWFSIFLPSFLFSVAHSSLLALIIDHCKPSICCCFFLELLCSPPQRSQRFRFDRGTDVATPICSVLLQSKSTQQTTSNNSITISKQMGDTFIAVDSQFNRNIFR